MLKTQVKAVKIHSITSTLAEDSIVVDDKRIYKSSFHQTTADLGYDAASRLLEAYDIDKNDVGILLFGSKTPDYRSPITAAVMQGRLNLPIDCICYDINVGINAFAQLTQIGSSVLKNTNKKYGLLIFGDTPSKLHNNAVNHEFVHSDAATAILLEKTDNQTELRFFNFSLGLYSDAITLKKGGFRNFNPNQPFDATEKSNFVVTTNEELINQAVHAIDWKLLDDFTKGSTIFYHSQFLKYAKPSVMDVEDNRIVSDASELPMLLALHDEKNINTLNDLTFISLGEGLSVFGMRINNKPFLLKTTHSTEIFQDFRISHEM